MELAKLGIALRPRNHWEAIDLGFNLARRWFIPLSLLWLLTALPVALLLLLLFNDNIVLLSLLLWWFKPLYEPPLVFWLSRAVFGDKLPIRSVRRGWWRIVKPQLLANLTWRRFSTNRSFYMPVALLEGLKGKPRRERLNLLGRRQQAGTWLTIVGIHFETLLEICFISTIYFLIPEELRWFDGENFFLSPGPIDEWIQLLCWLAAMALIAPFYVAGGFALYLHRRSELEGWDIEINFRKTVEEHTKKRSGFGKALATFLLVVLLVGNTPDVVHAATGPGPGPEQSKQTIEQVLEDPHFGQREEKTYWRYVGDSKSKPDDNESGWLSALLDFLGKVVGGFLQGIAGFGEVILWGLVAIVVAYLLYQFSRNRNWMQGLGRSSGHRKRVIPSQLFGLDMQPESLPDDIGQEALAMTRAGNLRAALSLLYRGTLIRLIADYQLDIPDSATEGECLALVRQHRQPQEANFFQALMQQWQLTAYAHTTPDATRVKTLCQEWNEVYGHVEA